MRTTIVLSDRCMVKLRHAKRSLGIPQGEIVNRCLDKYIDEVIYEAKLDQARIDIDVIDNTIELLLKIKSAI